jgi:hypothetical protein
MKKFSSYFVIFFLGFAIGMSFKHILRRSPFKPHRHPGAHAPRDPSEHFVGKLSESLGLDEPQAQKALSIFKRQHEKLEVIRKETVPRFQEIRRETQNDIRKLLSDEQKKVFDEMIIDHPKGPPRFGGPPPHGRDGPPPPP